MADNMLYLNEEELENLLKEKDKTVFVDFYADWCQPCRMLSPIIESLADKYPDTITFVKIDIDKENSLAMKNGVMSIPTTIIYKNGEVFSKDIGLHPAEYYEDLLK